MSTTIRVEHYCKTIKKVTILDDVTITFESGKVYGLKGKNGSGKTMLMRAISGLILPTSGAVYINDQQLGKEISFPPSIGMLLENPVEPQVIKSTAKGILQHDAMSWQIEGPHFVSASLSESAISLHETLHNWLENIDENARTQFVDDLFSILESTGVDTLTQVQEGGLKNAAAMLRELHQIVPGTWSELENLLKAVLPFSGFLIMGRQKTVDKQNIPRAVTSHRAIHTSNKNHNENKVKQEEKRK